MIQRVRFLPIVIVAALFLLVNGREVPEVDAADGGSSLSHELSVFSDVLALIGRDYVTPPDNKLLIEGAIKGMLQTLDPHSSYLNPEFYNDLKGETKGEFAGIGIEVTLKDSLLTVVSPIEGSPAAAAGMESGDIILKINGKTTKDLSLFEAVKLMRGKVGEELILSILHRGDKKMVDVKLRRENIHIKSVKSKLLEKDVGYIRIAQFQDSTADEVVAAIKVLLKQTSKRELAGLVLDLRNNPGGLLSQAVKVADLFVDRGIIVYTESRVDSQRQPFYAQPSDDQPPYPIVVLINEGSASAAEIVAGALKDHGRAMIVGKQSFGKGSVQTIFSLKNDGAIRLTTALYYTKSGNSIQARGVEPDILVEATKSDANEVGEQMEERSQLPPLRESALPGAITNPSGHHDVNAPPAKLITPTEQGGIEDMQLQKALEILLAK